MRWRYKDTDKDDGPSSKGWWVACACMIKENVVENHETQKMQDIIPTLLYIPNNCTASLLLEERKRLFFKTEEKDKCSRESDFLFEK